jgi:hypothetical protein
MSRRTFKERNSNRINFMILQEQAEIEAQRLRDENDQARNTLAMNLDTTNIVARATERAFQSIENQAMMEVGQ